MHKKLEELLKKLGVKQEVLTLFTDEEKATELESLSIDTVISDVTGSFKQRFENDQNFLDPIEKRIRGKVLGSKERNILKHVPEITKEEIEGLPQETRYDSLVELAIEKISERNKAGGKDDNEALKLAKLEAKKLQEKVEEYESTTIPQIKAKFQSEIEDFQLLDATKRHLSSKSDKIIGNVDFLAKSVLADAKENFVVKLQDGKPKLYQRPKEGQDQLLEAYDGNNPLTYEARIDHFLNENQFIRKSNATPPGGVPNPDPTTASKYHLPGLAAAEANAQSMGN